jgi:hypothetical protein
MCNGHEYLQKNNGSQNLCLTCYRKYNAEYNRNLRKSLSEQLNEFKLNSGCKKCFYK